MPAKKKPAAKKEEAAEPEEEASEPKEEPAPKKKAAAKKAAEPADSSSSSSDSSSSSSDEDPAPKKKASAKGKASAAKAKKEEAPAAKAAEESSSDSEEEKSEKEEEKPAEKVFEPPPRPVFTPHTAMGDITGAQELEYCPTCGLPPDFCSAGPSWDKCKPWCMEKYPHYYPELSGVSLEDAKAKAAKAASGGKVKELPGGKKKAEASPSVEIKKMSRGGRKCVTSVAGLDAFGVKLDNAAKLFKKKFSCGCSVVKGEHGSTDTVDIQGDFEEEVVTLCAEEFGIPRGKVSFVDGGTKKKGKGGAGGRPEGAR